jgi:ATP-dependent DNA ligase
VSRASTLPEHLRPMLATLTDAPFDDAGWVFEDKFDGFRMVASIEHGQVTLYSRNGKIISHSYIEVARGLEGVKGDAVMDGELVALDKNGVRTSSCCRMRSVTRRSSFTAPSTLCFLTARICVPYRCLSAKSG